MLLEHFSRLEKQTTFAAIDALRVSTVDRDLNLYKIAMPLFGAAYAAPQFYSNFPVLMSPLPQSSISEVEFKDFNQDFS